MKRVLFLAFALAACPRSPPPVIDSFTVDQPNPDVGAAVTFSYAVRGASTVSIEPAPGVVHASPVIVVPPAAGTFTLRATNEDGVEATSGIAITLRPSLAINAADAIPALVEALQKQPMPGDALPDNAAVALGKIGPAAKAALPDIRKNFDGKEELRPISMWAMVHISPDDDKAFQDALRERTSSNGTD